jgi:DNA modification methylase
MEYKHATQKPIDAMKKPIIFSSKENDIIFDPFLGSGTTAVACKQLKRNYIGCEISKEYCEIAQSRLDKMTRQLF